MNTHRHERPLVFITFPYLALIVLAALLASMTMAVFNKIHGSRTPEIPVRGDDVGIRH